VVVVLRIIVYRPNRLELTSPSYRAGAAGSKQKKAEEAPNGKPMPVPIHLRASRFFNGQSSMVNRRWSIVNGQ
jgi:hypothetical protein